LLCRTNNKSSLFAQIDADPAYEGAHCVIAIIVHIDKTTLDGLRKYSAFPVYISLGNYS
jgi:hypothetical protein